MACVTTMNSSNYSYASFGNSYTDADIYDEYIKNPYYVSETDIDSIIKQNNINCDSNENISFNKNTNTNTKIIIPPTVYKIHTPAGGIGKTIEDINNEDNDSIASSVCSSCYPDSSEEDNIIPLTPNESVISNTPDTSIISGSLTGVTRSVMYEYLIKYFPEYTEINNKQKMVKFLSTQLMCDCTDCGGSDSFCECEIESEYEKHFGLIVEYNEV